MSQNYRTPTTMLFQWGLGFYNFETFMTPMPNQGWCSDFYVFCKGHTRQQEICYAISPNKYENFFLLFSPLLLRLFIVVSNGGMDGGFNNSACNCMQDSQIVVKNCFLSYCTPLYLQQQASLFRCASQGC